MNIKIDQMKEYFDSLVEKYETEDFIKSDPVQFPHRFENQADIEISGLISSSLAYGKRQAFIEKLECIHKIMGKSPAEFCLNFDIERDSKFFDDFLYRFTTGQDISLFINAISQALKEHSTLEKLFIEGYSKNDATIKYALEHFVTKLSIYNGLVCRMNNRGFCHLLPNPVNGSACKRLNLFIKWMVRKGPVDLYQWKDISPSKLVIPLDIHVSNVSKKLNLTSRKANDWKTAEEITQKLREFDPNDPVKYDFALFDIGIDKLL